MADSFAVQLDKILDDYSVQAKRAINNSMDVVAKEAVKKLKNSSPKRAGHGEYARGWGVKRSRGRNGINDVLVYNRTHGQLTHLLENGHDVYNGKGGPFGRAPAIKHIAPVEQWANSELPAEVERELE